MVVVRGGVAARALLLVHLGEVCSGVFGPWWHYSALVGRVVVSVASSPLDHGVLLAPLVVFLGHGSRRRVTLRSTRNHGGLGLTDRGDSAIVLVVAVVSVDGRVEREATVVDGK